MLKCLRNHSKNSFSKLLLIQESALVWISTIALIALAYICIIKGYVGSLPWLATISTMIFGAYGTSVGFYYNKAKAENSVNGITYETAMLQKKIDNDLISKESTI